MYNCQHVYWQCYRAILLIHDCHLIRQTEYRSLMRFDNLFARLGMLKRQTMFKDKHSVLIFILFLNFLLCMQMRFIPQNYCIIIWGKFKLRGNRGLLCKIIRQSISCCCFFSPFTLRCLLQHISFSWLLFTLQEIFFYRNYPPFLALGFFFNCFNFLQ